MKYLLKDIELWVYDNKNYPKLLKDKKLNSYINKKYNISDFKILEKKVSSYLKNKGYKIFSIMNPLYMDSKSTVINFDLLNNNKIIPRSRDNKKAEKKFFKILSLLNKHKKIFIEIFNSGKGTMKCFRNKGILFSKDPNLYKIENEIYIIIEKDKKNIVNFLKKYSSINLLECLQWAKKDNEIIELLIKKIKDGDEGEKNIALLQFIPIAKTLNKIQQKKLLKLIEKKVLLFPSSCVRNKALSVIMEFPKEVLILSDNLKRFVKKISKTNQLNSNYPAKQIIKTLGM
ncbi:MAG: hypothetical protein ABIA02_03665 [Candidatus Falkowbacteria bacterium]